MVKDITIDYVEKISFVYAKEKMEGDEIIPPFNSRYPGKLESCLAVPFQSFGGVEPYATLVEKSAILFYVMVKNHPFQNGNKRLAIATLLTFLGLNEKWLAVENDMLYHFTKDVATSDAKKQNEALETIKIFIADHLVDFPYP